MSGSIATKLPEESGRRLIDLSPHLQVIGTEEVAMLIVNGSDNLYNECQYLIQQLPKSIRDLFASYSVVEDYKELAQRQAMYEELVNEQGRDLPRQTLIWGESHGPGTRIDPNGFDICYARLPYYEDERPEVLLGRDPAERPVWWFCQSKLRTQGVGIFAIKASRLLDPRLMRGLLGRFEPIGVLLPRWGGEDAIFIGRVREQFTHVGESQLLNILAELREKTRVAYQSYSQSFYSLAGDRSSQMPTIQIVGHGPPGQFESTRTDPATLVQASTTSQAWEALHKSATMRRDALTAHPPLPLRQGHVALVVPTGRLDGCVGTDELRHVVKGRVVRRRSEPVEVTLDDGRVETTTHESLCFEITAMTPDGTVYRYTSDAADTAGSD